MYWNKIIPELSVTNLENSLKFYTTAGFKIEYERPENNFVFISLGEIQFMLQEITNNDKWNLSPLVYPFGNGINFQLEVTNLEEIYNNFKNANYKIAFDIEENWYRQDDKMLGNKEFLIQDPDGYLLRFFEDIKECKKENPLEKYLTDIEKALNSSAHLSACALALTLPDICRKIQYPEISKRAGYAKWFDDWIFDTYYYKPEPSNNKVEDINNVVFNGEVCYLLRCAFLHSGNTEIEDEKDRYHINRFELCINSKSELQYGETYGLEWEDENNKLWHIRINIIEFINNMISGCRNFINKNQNIIAKYNKFINIIDFDNLPKIFK